MRSRSDRDTHPWSKRNAQQPRFFKTHVTKGSAQTNGHAHPLRRALAYAAPSAALLCYGGFTTTLDLALVGVLLAAHLSLRPASELSPWKLHAVAWLALLWTLLQALLPCQLTRTGSPGWCQPLAAEVRHHGSTLSFGVPHSVDPGNTWVYVIQGVAIVLALLVGTNLVRRRRRYELVASCALASALICSIAVFHKLGGLDSLFGIYEPTRNLHLLSPLLNTNHFGAVTAAGALLSIGLSLDTRRPGLRPLWIMLAVLTALCVAWSASRAAAGGFVVGALTLFWLVRRNTARSERASVRKPLLAALGLTAVASLVGYMSPLRNSIENSDYSKLSMIADAASAVLFSPLFGTGRGGFSSLYTRLWGNDRPYFPENFLVTWAVEWGLFVTLLLVIVLLGLLVRAVLGRPKPTQAAAIAAIVSLAVHDLADFALEMTGIAVYAALVMSAAVTSGSALRKSLRPAWLPFGAGAAAGAAALLLGLSGHISERAEAFVVHAAKPSDGSTLAWRQAVADHPNDPAVLLIASRLAERDEVNALAVQLVNRAMLRAPSWPGPHIQAARLLAKAGRVSQAMLELREAEATKSGSAHQVLCALAKSNDLPAALLHQAVPEEGTARLEVLSRLWKCLRAESPLSSQIYEELAKAPPKELPSYALRRLARHKLDANELADARSLLEIATNKEPERAEGWMLLARTYAQASEPANAHKVLLQGEKFATRPEKILFEQARLHAAENDMAKARNALRGVRAVPTSRRSDRAAAMRLLGQLEAEAGNLHLAIEAYPSAYRFGHQQGLREASQAAARTGAKLVAERLRREHCEKRPDDAWCTKNTQ